MKFQRINQFKKRNALLVLALLLSGVLGALIQDRAMNVSADIKPIVVGISEMSFGIVFPGENITGKEFTISLADGEKSNVKYKIIKQRSDKNGNECENINSEDCLPDLCPYINPVLIDDESDTTDNASLDPDKDNIDKWKINLEVPAIEGFIAQSFVGIPTGQNGLHGCRLSVDIDGEEPPTEDRGSIAGYKFNDLNQNGIFDIGEMGLSGWNIQLIKCPYSPQDSGTKIFLEKSTINENPEPGTSGFCSVIKTVTTDGNGYYIFEDLDKGDYGVNEILKASWAQTYPENNKYYYLNLQEKEKIAAINFLNHYEEAEPVCGNGVAEGNEKCDDGNLTNGDGCESNCTITTNPVITGGGGGGVIISLKITNEKVTNITQTTADFTWLTNLKADSRVVCLENETWEDVFGNKPNYGYSSSTITYDTDPTVTSHTVTLTGLKPDTKYSCRVVSAKNEKEVISSELDFRTANEDGEIITITNLNIFDLKSGVTTNSTFESSWKTNRDATTCIVYGETSVLSTGTEPSFGYNYRTAGCDQLDKQSTNHNQLVSGLKACTTYYYRAVAYNGVQRAVSPEQSIKTACAATVAGISYINPVASSPQISENPPSTEKEDENGEVKEAETAKAPACGVNGISDCVNGCLLWLLILIIVLLLLYIWKKREDEKRLKRQSGDLG